MATTTTTWYLNLKDSISGPLKKMQGGVDNVSKRVGNAGKALNKLSAIDMMAVDASAQQLKASFEAFNQPFIKFESKLAEVEAITGVTGKALDALGVKAKASARIFGGSATDSLENYKTILSRLGPDIAKSPEALDLMERSVRTLSKTMGGDSVAAVDALTTGMLQYGIDLSDPIKAQKEMANMMNVMAAAAQEGAAEVPSISQALKVAGVQAKLSKVSFEGSNAAIQELAKGGKVGAEAGTALRNVLGKMAGEDIIPKEAAGKLRALGVDMSVVSDTSIPFTDRLRELKKAQGDATVMAQVFGVENAAAANILLNSVDAQDALKAKITGTNSAQEQANVIMGTSAEKLSRLNAWYDNMKISIGKYTTAAQPFVQIGADSISMMANMANAQRGVTAAMAAGKAMLGIKTLAESAAVIKTKLLSTWTRITTVSQWNLNAAMMANPIGVIIIAIIALVAIIAVCWAKFEGFRNVIFQGWEAMKLFGNVIKDYVINRFKELLKGVTGIGKSLLHFFNGEWSKAWQTGKNAMVDLSGAGSAGAAIDQAKEGLPGALAKGKSRSAAYTANKNASPEVGAVAPLAEDTTGLLDLSGKKKKDPVTPAGGTGSAAKENALAIGGTGTGGGSKTINMTLNIVNNFSTSESTNARAMADKVMGHVNDKLRDAVTNLG